MEALALLRQQRQRQQAARSIAEIINGFGKPSAVVLNAAAPENTVECHITRLKTHGSNVGSEMLSLIVVA